MATPLEPVDDLVLTTRPSGSGAVCREILSTLPTWFGVPDANEEYVAHCDRTPTLIASLDGRAVGLTSIVRHSDWSAEVHLMAVVPEHHRSGIGRRMLQHAEAELAADGVEFLQVKTLSSRHPDPGYVKTRAFYEAYGFRPLEEMPDLWNPENPALIIIKTVPPAS
jgi:ribosomal protein S18 acetylase RimI-like enzyme